MAFDYGGKVSGQTTSTAAQSASVQFIPSVRESAPPVVSPYPAGQGLATINSAYPASAAWLPSTYAASSTSSTSSLSTLLILAALGAAAWWLLRKKGRG